MPDFIGISETWSKEPNELIQLENYHFLCERRESRTGGWSGDLHQGEIQLLNEKRFKIL